MSPAGRTTYLAQAFACWNWKCALLSASARSVVYLSAMVSNGRHGALSVVLVEIAYVTLTAGLYAGMQQKALGLRSRLLGNATVALAVPGLAQFLDWVTHRAVGASAGKGATLTVCVFTFVSAVFHLYVMRRGAFLTGRRSDTLLKDFRRMPRLAVGFLLTPIVSIAAFFARSPSTGEPEAAL